MDARGLLQEVQNDRISVNDAAGRLSETPDAISVLNAWSADRESRPLALYIASEMPKLPEHFWKTAARFIHSGEFSTVYSALDILHNSATAENFHEILSFIHKADVKDPRLFARVCLMLSLVPDRFIGDAAEKTCRGHSASPHCQGLMAVLKADASVVETMLMSSSVWTRLYACAAVCRRFSGGGLRRKLPRMVQEDLTLTTSGNAPRGGTRHSS